MIDSISRDFSIATRRLLRHRSFTIVAILTLMLGIGANSAIFSVIDAVLLAPLPFADQERLVQITEVRAGSESEDHLVSAHEFDAWRSATAVIDKMSMYRQAEFTLTGHGVATAVSALQTTANHFDVLGIRPELGRGFAAGEDSAGSHRVVVLSHRFWLNRFTGDSTIIGKSISLDNNAYQVVGVMRSSGEFDPDLWVPLDYPAEVLTVGRHATSVIAHVRRGIPIARAQTEIRAISRRLEADLPKFNTGHTARLEPMYESIVGGSRRALLVALGAVAFVLLIACSNVAHLLLTRAAGRRRELAICAAVGASRGRLITQVLTESILLSLTGGLLGLLLASWIIDFLKVLPSMHIPRIGEARINDAVILSTLALATLTGVLSGIAPAIRASRISVNEWLASGVVASDHGGRRLSDVLVVTELALAMVLLVGAGLMLKSFATLSSVRPGFDPHHVLVVSTSLPPTRYSSPALQRQAIDELTQRLRNVHGVADVGATTEVPIAMCCNGIAITVEDAPAPEPGNEARALMRSVDEHYFSAMRIPLRAGRTFAISDARKSLPLIRWWAQQPYPEHFNDPQAAPVAVINETMARRYWPSGDAIGRRFKAIESPWITVIGIVGDVRNRGLDAELTPEFHLALSQEPRDAVSLVVRTADGTDAVLPSVEHEIRQFDRDLPIRMQTTMDDVVSNSIGGPRFNSLALLAFASLAMTLALVGIYGVISHAVTQRTREIGIRTALGASAADVMTLMLRRAVLLTTIGLTLGVVFAVVSSRVLTSMLFGVTPTDPMTYVGMTAALAAASLLASYIPARRALRVDPLIALRTE